MDNSEIKQENTCRQRRALSAIENEIELTNISTKHQSVEGKFYPVQNCPWLQQSEVGIGAFHPGSRGLPRSPIALQLRAEKTLSRLHPRNLTTVSHKKTNKIRLPPEFLFVFVHNFFNGCKVPNSLRTVGGCVAKRRKIRSVTRLNKSSVDMSHLAKHHWN